MKKAILTSVMIALVLSLVGCGQSKELGTEEDAENRKNWYRGCLLTNQK